MYCRACKKDVWAFDVHKECVVLCDHLHERRKELEGVRGNHSTGACAGYSGMRPEYDYAFDALSTPVTDGWRCRVCGNQFEAGDVVIGICLLAVSQKVRDMCVSLGKETWAPGLCCPSDSSQVKKKAEEAL